MSLSQIELFKATVAHQKHEGILFQANFIPELEHRVRAKYGLDDKTNLRDYFGMFNPGVAEVPQNHVEQSCFWKYYEDVEKPEGTYLDLNGVLHLPGSMYHFTHYISPLRDATSFEQIESFPYEDVSGVSDRHMADEVEQAHSQDKVATSCITHMYEEAWQIRGYEPFLMDMIVQPEWCEFILDKLMERNMIRATAAARAGVDYIITGDDVANQNALMFSIENWRKFMKSRWAKVYSAAKAIKPDLQIWYHSDGNIMDIIPELIEIGVDILNPVQPECMDPVEIKKLYGDKIVFDGTIGTQSTMPFGSPDDVRNVIKENVSKLGYDGALMLSPTHVLEPEVPLENIAAFVEAAKSM